MAIANAISVSVDTCKLLSISVCVLTAMVSGAADAADCAGFQSHQISAILLGRLCPASSLLYTALLHGWPSEVFSPISPVPDIVVGLGYWLTLAPWRSHLALEFPV